MIEKRLPDTNDAKETVSRSIIKTISYNGIIIFYERICDK